MVNVQADALERGLGFSRLDLFTMPEISTGHHQLFDNRLLPLGQGARTCLLLAAAQQHLLLHDGQGSVDSGNVIHHSEQLERPNI
jgi:hypothetical protein